MQLFNMCSCTVHTSQYKVCIRDDTRIMIMLVWLGTACVQLYTSFTVVRSRNELELSSVTNTELITWLQSGMSSEHTFVLVSGGGIN